MTVLSDRWIKNMCKKNKMHDIQKPITLADLTNPDKN